MSCPIYIEPFSIDNDWLADTGHGRRVHGLPGIGKTTLLRRLERLAHPDPALHPDWDKRLINTVAVYLGAGFTLAWPGLLDKFLAGVDYTSPDGGVVSQLAEVYRDALWHLGNVAMAADDEEQAASTPAEPPTASLPDITRPDTSETDPLPPSSSALTSPSWMGYFHHLHRHAPNLTILFLLDDLDEAPGVLEPEQELAPLPLPRISPRHILLFGSAPNVKVIAASVHADFDPGIAGWFSNFSSEPLFPFDLEEIKRLVVAHNLLTAMPAGEAAAAQSIAEEILSLTGGIPELVCSLLAYYVPRGNRVELTSTGKRTWMREYLQPWYERIRAKLPQYERVYLAKVAEARKPYNVDSHNDCKVIRVLDTLSERSLLSRHSREVNDPRPEVEYWTYQLTSDGLRQLLRGSAPQARVADTT